MHLKKTTVTRWAALAALLAAASAPPALADEMEEGFQTIFDGQSLDGWDGDPKFWRVEDATITGHTTPENPTPGNTFIIWKGGEPGDFELKLEYRIVGGNSGIQYRSRELPDQRWVVAGYQADFVAGRASNGILYEERGRGVLAQRGQKTVVERTNDRHEVKVVGETGDPAELQAQIREEDWNEYHVIARGFHLVHKINGHTMVEVTDNDEQARCAKGIIAFQLHAGPPMLLQFRNIRLQTLDDEQPAAPSGDDRPPAVARAVAAYEGACEKARDKLLESFDTSAERLAKQPSNVDERLTLLDALKEEKPRFEERGLIPWSRPMWPHVDEYQNSLVTAERQLRRAYATAINRGLRSGEMEQVDELRADLDRLLEARVVAAWRYRAGRGPRRLLLYSNGRFGEPDSGQTWSFRGGVLVLLWPDARAPGGAWRDVCAVSPDGASYQGRNQNRRVITGDYLPE